MAKPENRRNHLAIHIFDRNFIYSKYIKNSYDPIIKKQLKMDKVVEHTPQRKIYKCK